MTNPYLLQRSSKSAAKESDPEPTFGVNSIVCIGTAGKETYARGTVVRQGEKLVGKYGKSVLKRFVELTSLHAVADKCTVQRTTDY